MNKEQVIAECMEQAMNWPEAFATVGYLAVVGLVICVMIRYM